MTFRQVSFDKDDFTSLVSREPKDEADVWVGQDFWVKDKLANPDELDALKAFIAELGELQNPAKLFKQTLDKSGKYNSFYGPGIFRDKHNTGLVLMLGENFFPCTLADGTFTCGKLRGILSERKANDKAYPAVTFSDQSGHWEFVVSLRTVDPATTRADLKPLLNTPASFIDLVHPIPKDRGTFINLPDLGECEIKVIAIEEAHTKFGPKYYLTLDHSIFTRTNTALTNQIAKNRRFKELLEEGETLTLACWGHDFTSSGNAFCKAGLYAREPEPSKEYLTIRAQNARSIQEEADLKALVSF